MNDEFRAHHQYSRITKRGPFTSTIQKANQIFYNKSQPCFSEFQNYKASNDWNINSQLQEISSQANQFQYAGATSGVSFLQVKDCTANTAPNRLLQSSVYHHNITPTLYGTYSLWTANQSILFVIIPITFPQTLDNIPYFAPYITGSLNILYIIYENTYTVISLQQNTLQTHQYLSD